MLVEGEQGQVQRPANATPLCEDLQIHVRYQGSAKATTGETGERSALHEVGTVRVVVLQRKQ